MKKLTSFYRINNWWYYLGFVILGYVARFGYISLDLVSPLLSTSFLLAYVFSLNDYYDGDIEKKIFIFPLLIFIITLFFLDWFQVLVCLTIALVFTLYSHPLTRLKAKPLFSTFSNSVSFSLLFFIGYHSIDTFSFLFFLLLICLNTPAQLFHEIVDEWEDKRKGDITTTVKYGYSLSKNLSIFSLALAASLSILLFYLKLINIIFFLSTLVFTLYFSLKAWKSKINSRSRKMYRNFGIIVGTIYFLSFLFT